MFVYVFKFVVVQVLGIDVNCIDDVIIGCVMLEVEQGMNVVCIGVLLVGLLDIIVVQMVNCFCFFGLQVVVMVVDQIWLGNVDLMLVGGIELMLMVLMMGNKIVMVLSVFDNDYVVIVYGMGIIVEKVVEEWKVLCEEQDVFVFVLYQKVIVVIQNGEFKDEISFYDVCICQLDLVDGCCIIICDCIVDIDEGLCLDLLVEGLVKLCLVFCNGQFGGIVIVGNLLQMSDGVGVVLLVFEQVVKDYGFMLLVCFVSFLVVGVCLEVMGIGLIVVILKVFRQVGLIQDQLDWIEFNEVFVVQLLVVICDCGLDLFKVNLLGGVIVFGYLLGVIGVICIVILLYGLCCCQQKYGMVIMCIGIGMGVVGIFELL